jgi:hypothetical protein
MVSGGRTGAFDTIYLLIGSYQSNDGMSAIDSIDGAIHAC